MTNGSKNFVTSQVFCIIIFLQFYSVKYARCPICLCQLVRIFGDLSFHGWNIECFSFSGIFHFTWAHTSLIGLYWQWYGGRLTTWCLLSLASCWSLYCIIFFSKGALVAKVHILSGTEIKSSLLQPLIDVLFSAGVIRHCVYCNWVVANIVHNYYAALLWVISTSI